MMSLNMVEMTAEVRMIPARNGSMQKSIMMSGLGIVANRRSSGVKESNRIVDETTSQHSIVVRKSGETIGVVEGMSR